MKVYKVKVNGKTYKVELESIEENKASMETKAVAKEEVKATPVASVPAGEGKEVVSPIQGTVVNIKANVGQSVKKGDVLVIVEAMKLENEVVSPFDGTVAQVLVSKGQNVTAKQAMFIIK